MINYLTLPYALIPEMCTIFNYFSLSLPFSFFFPYLSFSLSHSSSLIKPSDMHYQGSKVTLNINKAYNNIKICNKSCCFITLSVSRVSYNWYLFVVFLCINEPKSYLFGILIIFFFYILYAQ